MAELCPEAKYKTVMQELERYKISNECKFLNDSLYLRGGPEQGSLPADTVRHNLAVFCFLYESDLEKAVVYTEEALKIRRDFYRNTHPSTISSRVNLGTFYLLNRTEPKMEEKGLEIYCSLLKEIKRFEEEAIMNIRQVPCIIWRNMEYLFKAEIQEILSEIGGWTYCVGYQTDIARQLYETYGV